MTKAADVKRIVEEAVKAFGNEIHVLVNVVSGIRWTQEDHRARRRLV